MRYLLLTMLLVGCSPAITYTSCDYVDMNIMGWTCPEHGNMTSDKGAFQLCPESCVPIVETIWVQD